MNYSYEVRSQNDFRLKDICGDPRYASVYATIETQFRFYNSYLMFEDKRSLFDSMSDGKGFHFKFKVRFYAI